VLPADRVDGVVAERQPQREVARTTDLMAAG
jgi:hypothetical protein